MQQFGTILAWGLLTAATLTAQSESKWVHFGEDYRLQYSTDARGNRIMDFSHAGYKGGGVAMPEVPAIRVLGPAIGDSTARIQSAIDEVSALQPDEGGFRGAVLLEPGVYEVAGTLRIGVGGVVLRGSGSGEGGTKLSVTGEPHRLLDMRGSGEWQPLGEPVTIVDRYIPSGADWFHVESAAGLAVGDTILIQRPVTEAWIRFMGMDKLVRDGRPQTWLPIGRIINADRTIKAISPRGRITLDVPLSDSYDAAYLDPPGTTAVKYAFPGRIEQVGLESLRVSVPPQDVPISQGQFNLLRMDALSDGWVRDVVVEDTQNTITIGPAVRRVTLQNVHIRHNMPFSGAASPADVAISGTQVLIDRCSVTGKRVWPVVTQVGVTGPNVVLHFSSDEAGVAPHQRWATGLLVDSSEFSNGTELRPNIAFSNREYAGSGHGWSAGWSVAWNVRADYLLIQQPPGSMNWCIGCAGRYTPILWHGDAIEVPEIPSETIESPGVPVEPASLYLWQLRERLGETALENIGYGRPAQ